ncbi:MAG: hypothetical protein AAGU76_02755 [Sedimentibacter sp.]|uniref:hypothetical protein n=1 Tax=Sedimentibacter sp. TaxID=1960295 RepID=UPI003159536B
MINANMKNVDVYTITKTYNNLGIEIESETKVKTIQCFIALRSTETKMFEQYSYELGDYIGITKDTSVIKGNVLKINNESFKVVESLNILRYNNLLLKKVN